LNPATEDQLARLLLRAQAGDRVAYAQFLLQTRELVRPMLRQRIRSPALLDDLLQETLLSVHRSRHTYDPARPIGPWICAIAFNRLRDFGRARRRRQDRDRIDLEWEQAVHANTSTDALLPGLLRAALDSLSDAQREVVWLLKFEGYSVAEVAGHTGRSTSAIKVTAHRAYRALRVLLGSR
jgi:RNA polymerase sigma-70 factor (ECF subfamily)